METPPPTDGDQDPTEPVAATPPPQPPPQPRRLMRSRTDRILGGVGGGLAEHLGIDPLLVRFGIGLLVVVTGGAGLLLYVAAWLLVPDAPLPAGQTVPPPRSRAATVGGVVALIALACIIVPSGIVVGWLAVPFAILALIGLGVWWLVDGHPGRSDRSQRAPRDPARDHDPRRLRSPVLRRCRGRRGRRRGRRGRGRARRRAHAHGERVRPAAALAHRPRAGPRPGRGHGGRRRCRGRRRLDGREGLPARLGELDPPATTSWAPGHLVVDLRNADLDRRAPRRRRDRRRPRGDPRARGHLRRRRPARRDRRVRASSATAAAASTSTASRTAARRPAPPASS